MTTLDSVAEDLRNGRFKKVVFMVGAGISTSAGIPDFRSPDTGLYANLEKLKLPYPEAVFDISYFKRNPKAFYTLADELYPGKFEPTLFHHFIKKVQDKGLLLRVFTQNIDTLERIAGVEGEYIVEAHGSFATNRCIKCQAELSMAEMREAMRRGKTRSVGIPRCKRQWCNGLVKPDIVFFGESLPHRFFERMEQDIEKADLAIIAGTSLTVYPFAELPNLLSEECVRVLINMERVGDLGARESDVVVLGDCDTKVQHLVDLLSWGDQEESGPPEPADMPNKAHEQTTKTEEPEPAVKEPHKSINSPSPSSSASSAKSIPSEDEGEPSEGRPHSSPQSEEEEVDVIVGRLLHLDL
ncbi:NAD-dependent protein deacetylase Hst2p [Trichomonascus vanleenenianus]|uniref:histone deacetylase HST2 n=1 Tax=Trichomonascus vanleenenianus TaxID=2268995 RepID=UPI003EC95C2A